MYESGDLACRSGAREARAAAGRWSELQPGHLGKNFQKNNFSTKITFQHPVSYTQYICALKTLSSLWEIDFKLKFKGQKTYCNASTDQRKQQL